MQVSQRIGTGDEQLAHVGEIEETQRGAHRAVLVDDRRVLHWHLPAGEGHHPGAERTVDLVQRRPPQDSLLTGRRRAVAGGR